MNIRLKPLAALLPLLSASNLQAQQTLDPVVVTGTRFESSLQEQPIATQVISADEIRESSATTVSEVLSKVGGVHTRISFTGLPDTPLDIRGFGMTGNQNTLLLINGQRLSEFEDTTARISAIPMDAIERIEIMRGSGAVLYGAGATGGTINIITRSPIAAPLSGNLFAQAGSHNSNDIRSGIQVGGNNWGMRLNAQHYETDNYRRNNRAQVDAMNGELRFADHEDFISLAFTTDDQSARLPGYRYESELSTDRRGTSFPNDYMNSNSQTFSLRGEKRLGEVTLALDVGHRDKQSYSYFDPGYGTSLMNTHADINTVSPRLLWKSKLSGVDNQLTAGMDWNDWSYTNNTSATGYLSSVNEHGKQTNRAIYLRDEIRFASGTRLTLGARRENIEQSHGELLLPNPEISVEHKLTAHELALQQELGSGFSAYGRTGRSFRVASIDENRCWSAPCPELLQPQTSRNKEVGVEWRGQGAGFRASLFDMSLENEIHYMNINPYLFTANINLPPTRHRGVELEGKVFVWKSVDLAARYTRTEAEFREGSFGGVNVAGNDMPLVPKDRVGLNAGWQAAANTRATLSILYVGNQRYDNDQANRYRNMPSYTVTDIKVSHQLGAWRLAAGINNLFDEKYYSYGIVTSSLKSFAAYPEDRRNAYMSAEYRF